MAGSDEAPQSTAPRGPGVPRLMVRALRAFLDTESVGALTLLAATLVALSWANSPWGATYGELWGSEVPVRLGAFEIVESVRGWVNDGAMTLFFFVVGLEIKRELASGELSDRRAAALPIVAALGGMAVPALIFVALNAGGPGAAGWGVPMATDIAFALGALALLGPHLPAGLTVFLLSLAIVDDIGSIIVIALFYADTIDVAALGVAVLLVGVVAVLKRLDVRWVSMYALVGAAVWLATLRSGVPATIAGVVLGLMTPACVLSAGGARPRRAPKALRRLFGGVESATSRSEESQPVAERLEQSLHPYTSYVVLPLFALANAGLVLDSQTLADTFSSPVTRGLVVARVAGKVVGITGFAWLAVRFRIATLPAEIGWRHITGAATVAAVGFTVSLFVAQGAYSDPALVDASKVGLFAASLIAAAAGALVLRPDRSHGRAMMEG